ncbi:hypothetical protein JCM33374_g5415 [Metschnikowia sp. JCM 33374]|nr:hypothetical protein JCM33374_g5415 [Metschnikowia sp. JCM 33374]
MSTRSERPDHLQKGSNVSPLESLIAAPLDTIKIRFQLSSVRSDGITGVDLVRNLLRNEGLLALWKGNVPAEALYILYGASQFTSYSVLNRWLFEFQNQNQYTLSQPTHSLLVGSGTGLISTLVTYPFDLLRTRLAAHESRVLLSMSETCKNIYASDGTRGFFVGLRPTLLSVVANSGLFFWSYSLAREAVDQINEISPGKIWGVEAICGFLAGSTAKAITFPLDTIRKRLQVTSGSHAFRMLVDHWRLYGFANFYRGFGVSLIKTAPTSAVSMAIYEYTLTTMRALSETF